MATPLPPVNLKYIGNRWPENAPIAIPDRRRGSLDIHCSTTKMGNVPFKISPNKVRPAPTLLPRRSTLVAPGLSEPCFRGSGRCKSIETKIALDKDPIR